MFKIKKFTGKKTTAVGFNWFFLFFVFFLRNRGISLEKYFPKIRKNCTKCKNLKNAKVSKRTEIAVALNKVISTSAVYGDRDIKMGDSNFKVFFKNKNFFSESKL